jgi:hypothetical protein
LANRGNWTAQLPVGGRAVVTLGEITGVDGLLAHPMGRLQFVQHVAPLGLDLDKFGNSRITGANRFDIAEIVIAGQAVTSPSLVSESFARSQFVEMSEEQKLTSPSFERFTAGFEVGAVDYSLPEGGEVSADLSYETHMLHRPVDFRLATLIRVTSMSRVAISMSEMRANSAMGAVARSAPARERRLASRPRAGVTVTDAKLAAVDATHMSPVADLVGVAARSSAAATQVIQEIEVDVKLIEASELEGAVT